MIQYTLDYNLINDYINCFTVLATRMVGPQLALANSRSCFISHFGVSPIVCAVTWYLIRTHVMDHHKIFPSFLLWTLHFLKNYENLEVLRTIIPGNPDTGVISEKVWIMIEKISKLGNLVVRIFKFLLCEFCLSNSIASFLYHRSYHRCFVDFLH
jgi:hypothetical protein